MAEKITTEVTGHILQMGINRPEKRNAFDLDMIRDLAAAYTRLSDDPNLRVGVLFAHGEHFTSGLDLMNVVPRIVETQGAGIVPEGMRDPWGVFGEPCTKPIVVAVHGKCFTLGIELVLAAEICVAADTASFAQLEVARGIVPMGGAPFRMPARLGWGNAMRYLLTADELSAAEALRLGLVQEVVPFGEQHARALAMAERIAACAPLGIQATLASARTFRRVAEQEAIAELRPRVLQILTSADAQEGVGAMLERRAAKFAGR